MSFVETLPPHEYNETLVKWAAPQDWQNPTPTGRYNMVVIGGGSAGLVIRIWCCTAGRKGSAD